MSLKHLKSHSTVQEKDYLPKRNITPFERKRRAAVTFEELYDLGCTAGMEFPAEWAERVLEARRRLQ